MALTEAEQRLLAQLEESLKEEDPRLAQKFASAPKAPAPAPLGKIRPRQATGAILGVLAGLVLLIVGMVVQWWVVSVVGFLVMLVSVMALLGAFGQPKPGPAKPTGAKPSASPQKGQAQASFMQRMERKLEQRWEDRRQSR